MSKFSRNDSGTIGESFREYLLIKSRNQNIFEKFKLNRNPKTIPFKMMYNMSMLRHRFSNERWVLSYSVKVCTCLSILLATFNYRVRGILFTHDLLVKQVER